MVGFTQKRKKKSAGRVKSKKLTRAVRRLRARIKKYEQCRDTKCTPEWIMDKELKNYSKTVKSKCGILPKNLNAVSDKQMRAQMGHRKKSSRTILKRSEKKTQYYMPFIL